MVGGTIVDIVKQTEAKWWVNCVESFARRTPRECAIFLNPAGEPIDVGDALWWQGGSAYWTPADRSRTDVRLAKIGFSGVAHPDKPRCAVCGCTLEFCQRHGGCESAQPSQETRYVDDMEAGFGRMKMCHMVADTVEELHAMADAIGVARRWVQYPGTLRVHYDIAKSKKELAVAAGAIEVTWRWVGMRDSALRRGLPIPPIDYAGQPKLAEER